MEWWGTKWAGAREESWNKSQQGPRPVGSQAREQEEEQQSEVSTLHNYPPPDQVRGDLVWVKQTDSKDDREGGRCERTQKDEAEASQ